MARSLTIFERLPFVLLTLVDCDERSSVRFPQWAVWSVLAAAFRDLEQQDLFKKTNRWMFWGQTPCEQTICEFSYSSQEFKIIFGCQTVRPEPKSRKSNSGSDHRLVLESGFQLKKSFDKESFLIWWAPNWVIRWVIRLVVWRLSLIGPLKLITSGGGAREKLL